MIALLGLEELERYEARGTSAISGFGESVSLRGKAHCQFLKILGN